MTLTSHNFWLKIKEFRKRPQFGGLVFVLLLYLLYLLGIFLNRWYWETHPLLGIHKWIGHGPGVQIPGGIMYPPILIEANMIHDKLIVRWFIFYSFFYVWFSVFILNLARIWFIGWKSVITYEGSNLFLCTLAVLGWSFTQALIIWGFGVSLTLGTPWSRWFL